VLEIGDVVERRLHREGCLDGFGDDGHVGLLDLLGCRWRFETRCSCG
jgi:hypothetical protein